MHFIVITKKSLKKIISILFLIFIIVCGLILIINFKSKPVISDSQTSYIAIIIDDFGNNRDGTNEFIKLDIPYTAAIMPSMPNTKSESMALFEKGCDIILHMPMESKTGKSSWLGKNALTTNLSNEEIQSNLSNSISQINNIVGINNHMGSKAMENDNIMELLINAAKINNLYVVDSKTTPKSKVTELGNKNGVYVLSRDIFLDSTDSQKIIENNLLKAAEISRKKGYCIAIGHVGNAGGKITANAIANMKDSIESKNIKFVTISQLLKIIKDQEV